MTMSVELSIIARQEVELRLPRLDEEIAWNLGVRLRQLAAERQLPVVIDIRRFGQVLFYCAMGGATPDNAEWVRRKSNIVARFFRSSYAVGLELSQNGGNLFTIYALPDADFAAHGGAFPIHVPEAGCVGSIAVSGLPQRLDHELVVEALCQHLGYDYEKLRLPDAAGS
jgi:uncharacterized protein (UPF0303 family)